jgi:hypothetical protein
MEMPYSIEINKVINGEYTEFVVGCRYAGGRKFHHLFQEIDNLYDVEPNNKDDYLVDFYENSDLIATVVTTKEYAQLIDDTYFKQ